MRHFLCLCTTVWIYLASTSAAYADIPIFGDQDVAVGEQVTYTATTSSPVLANWVIVKGTVLSNSVNTIGSQFQYSATVVWHTAGAGSVTLKSGNISTVGSTAVNIHAISNSSPWTESNGEVHYSGNVGVGNTNPTYKLDVSGDIRANSGWIRSTGDYGIYNNSDATYLYSDNSNYWRTRSDRGITIANRANTRKGVIYHDNANSFGLLDADEQWSVRFERDSNTRWYINNSQRMTLDNGGLTLTGNFRRTAHNTGHLEGSYNNVGENSIRSNPIYTIGSNYNPSSTSLSNMYGVGYTHKNASFINSTDLGVEPSTHWGMYVAADGNARIFLNGGHGHGYFKGDLFNQNLHTRGTLTLGTYAANQAVLSDGSNRPGLLKIKQNGANSWSGVSLEHTSTSAWSLMGDQDDFGLYDDYNNKWVIHYGENGSTGIYNNGSKKLNTTSSGINVTGTVSATGGNSDQWNSGYTERGSQIAGTGLVWSGGKLNSHWSVTGDDVYYNGDLRLKGGAILDDDGSMGGSNDDWMRFNGYIEMRSNTDNYGIVLRNKDASDYLGLTQKDGWSYFADSNTSSNYFLRGNGDDVEVRDNLRAVSMTATGSISASGGNSSNWNAAYSQRGSQIAGTGLTWSGTKLDVAESQIDAFVNNNGYYKSGSNATLGTLTTTGAVNIGGANNQTLTVRHINGKATTSTANGDLYLNYNTGKNVYVGLNTQNSNLQVYGNVIANGGNSTYWNTAYTQRGSQIAGTGLTWSGGKLNISNVNTDSQTLSLSGDNLTISGGNTINIGSVANNFWSVSGDDIFYNGDLRVKSSAIIDDDSSMGGNSDDWIKLNGYIELSTSHDSHGIVLREKGNTNYMSITQKGGWSYISDNSGYTNYFLRGNGANLEVRGTLSTGGTISTPSHGSSSNWQTAYLQRGELIAGTGLTWTAGKLNVSNVNTDDQNLSLAGNILTLEDGGTVNLASYMDNTDTQLTETQVDNFVSNNGYLTSETDDQALTLSGNILTLEDGGTVNLTSYMDNTDTQLTETQVDNFVSDNGYLTSETDDQALTLSGNILTLEDGGTVNLTSYMDNTDTQLTETQVDNFVSNNGYLTSETDDQALTLSGDILTLEDGGTVDLTSYMDNTDTQLTEVQVDNFVSNNGYLTSETDDQTLTLSGNFLTLEDGGTVDLTSYMDNTDTQLTEIQVDNFVSNNGYLTSETDDQALTLSGNILTLEDGGTVDLSSYMDNTDTQLTEVQVDNFVSNNGYLTSETDDQALTLSGNILTLEDGGTVDLTSYMDNTDTQLTEIQVDNFVSNNGYLTSETDDQALTLSGNILTLEDGGSVDLTSFIDNTDTQLTEMEVDNFVSNNGYLTVESDDQNAAEVSYDNTNSGLLANNTNSAIDEVTALINSKQGSRWTENNGNISYADSVSIGTSQVASGYLLSVAGNAIMEEINIKFQFEWPDYVFNEDYILPSLKSTKSFIQENNHLPNIPTAEEVEENGINVGEMNAKLLQKIEELTLHLIKQSEQIESLQHRLQNLEEGE